MDPSKLNDRQDKCQAASLAVGHALVRLGEMQSDDLAGYQDHIEVLRDLDGHLRRQADTLQFLIEEAEREQKMRADLM